MRFLRASPRCSSIPASTSLAIALLAVCSSAPIPSAAILALMTGVLASISMSLVCAGVGDERRMHALMLHRHTAGLLLPWPRDDLRHWRALLPDVRKNSPYGHCSDQMSVQTVARRRHLADVLIHGERAGAV